MSDRPMIFSAPMIRALLEGRKTMTRRVLKPQPAPDYAGLQYVGIDAKTRRLLFESLDGNGVPFVLSPYAPVPYAPGDRIWVREAIYFHFEHDNHYYEADQAGVGNKIHAQLRKKTARGVVRFGAAGRTLPSIHMPRSASRLTLVVTEVKVERLQEINWRDVRDEGAYTPEFWERRDEIFAPTNTEARAIFARVWNSIHGPAAWDRNPWVVVLRFTVHHCNIDEMKDAA